MGARKKGDTTARKRVVRQVCMTGVKAQMLEDVARNGYDGQISHAILDLIDEPLTERWAELDIKDSIILEEKKVNIF